MTRRAAAAPPGDQCITEADLDIGQVMRRFAAIEDRLDRGSERMAAIEADLRANTAATQAQTSATQAQTETLGEVRDLMEMGRSLFRLAGWLGKGFRWLGGIAAAAGAIWAAIYTITHGGKPPH